MSTRSFLAFLALGATSCQGRDPATEPTVPWVVSPRSAGPVRTGMTVAEASKALGADLKPTYDVSDICDMLDVPGGPTDLSLMVVSDTIVRFDVSDTLTATALTGLRVGSSEAQVLAAYPGKVRVEPHEYAGPDGHYLVVGSDSLEALVFETDGKRVTRYRAGRKPAVEWVEGCL